MRVQVSKKALSFPFFFFSFFLRSLRQKSSLCFDVIGLELIV